MVPDVARTRGEAIEAAFATAASFAANDTWHVAHRIGQGFADATHKEAATSHLPSSGSPHRMPRHGVWSRAPWSSARHWWPGLGLVLSSAPSTPDGTRSAARLAGKLAQGPYTAAEPAPDIKP